MPPRRRASEDPSDGEEIGVYDSARSEDEGPKKKGSRSSKGSRKSKEDRATTTLAEVLPPPPKITITITEDPDIKIEGRYSTLSNFTYMDELSHPVPPEGVNEVDFNTTVTKAWKQAFVDLATKVPFSFPSHVPIHNPEVEQLMMSRECEQDCYAGGDLAILMSVSDKEKDRCDLSLLYRAYKQLLGRWSRFVSYTCSQGASPLFALFGFFTPEEQISEDDLLRGAQIEMNKFLKVTRMLMNYNLTGVGGGVIVYSLERVYEQIRVSMQVLHSCISSMNISNGAVATPGIQSLFHYAALSFCPELTNAMTVGRAWQTSASGRGDTAQAPGKDNDTSSAHESAAASVEDFKAKRAKGANAKKMADFASKGLVDAITTEFTPAQILQLRIMEYAASRGLKRRGGYFYESVTIPPTVDDGIYHPARRTYAYRRWKAISSVVYELCDAVMFRENWALATGRGDTFKTVISHLETETITNVGYYTPYRYGFSFLNGIFLADTYEFFPHGDKGIPPELITERFYNCNFPYSSLKLDKAVAVALNKRRRHLLHLHTFSDEDLGADVDGVGRRDYNFELKMLRRTIPEGADLLEEVVNAGRLHTLPLPTSNPLPMEPPIVEEAEPRKRSIRDTESTTQAGAVQTSSPVTGLRAADLERHELETGSRRVRAREGDECSQKSVGSLFSRASQGSKVSMGIGRPGRSAPREVRTELEGLGISPPPKRVVEPPRPKVREARAREEAIEPEVSPEEAFAKMLDAVNGMRAAAGLPPMGPAELRRKMAHAGYEPEDVGGGSHSHLREMKALEARYRARFHERLRGVGGRKDAFAGAADMVQNWREIYTPELDKIMDQQEFPEEVQEWVLAFMGRQLFAADFYDSWQVAFMHKGAAGTGKSTMCRIAAGMYSRGDVGLLSNNVEPRFGLSSMLGKLMIICLEVKDGFGLSQAELQSMITNEEMSINRKFEKPVVTKLDCHVMMAGNKFPNWENNSDSIARRWLWIKYINSVMNGKGDPGLLERCFKKMHSIMAKCSGAYLEKAALFGNNSIWSCVPQYFVDMRNEMRADTHELEHFLQRSDAIQKGEGYSMPWTTFKAMFNDHCQKNNFPKRRVNHDYYSQVFKNHDIQLDENLTEAISMVDPDTGEKLNLETVIIHGVKPRAATPNQP